jgi:hypothetical protein
MLGFECSIHETRSAFRSYNRRRDTRRLRQAADGAGRDRKRHDAGPWRELTLEIVEVEAEVVRQAGEADDDAAILGALELRCDIAVVVELGHDDLVARAERAPERAGEEEVERRHARSESTSSGSQPRTREESPVARHSATNDVCAEVTSGARSRNTSGTDSPWSWLPASSG